MVPFGDGEGDVGRRQVPVRGPERNDGGVWGQVFGHVGVIGGLLRLRDVVVHVLDLYKHL